MENAFRDIPLLTNFDSSTIGALTEKKLICTGSYCKGKTIYNQNDPCETLDIVLTGCLVAYSLSVNGSATTMFEFRKDSTLGANLLFGESNAYPMSIYCLENCKVVHINREAVLELLHDYDFVMHYIQLLSQNSRGMNRKIAMLTQKTLRGILWNTCGNSQYCSSRRPSYFQLAKNSLLIILGYKDPPCFVS